MQNGLINRWGLPKRVPKALPGMVFGIIMVFLLLVMPGGVGVVDALAPDDVEADVALLVVAGTNQVLLEKNADKVVEPASIAKIMTMLLALEAVEKGESALTDQVLVSPDAEAIGGSQVWLMAGEVFTLQELLKAVAIQSANDAAFAVAEHVAGSVPAFVKQMNRRARELGMENTHFTNVHGLPPDAGEEATVTTAGDINKMAQALLEFPLVLEWTSTWSEVFRSGEPSTVLYNTNHLLREYPGLDGLKTGHTSSAGYCLVATAVRDDVRLVSIVMGTSSDAERRRQTRRLLDYGFKGFTSRRLVEANEIVGEAVIKNGSPERVKAMAAVALDALVEKGSTDDFQRELQLRPDLMAPLAAGEPIGVLVVTQDNRHLGQVPVVVSQDVRTAGVFTRIWRWLRDLVKSMIKTEATTR
ncbi:MAG: D-alanyl-D-alanine carboxypeptidase [Firmicutes bacterium]|nr:D-alanyl-D-alanine carboxypeptidase [Bacillota bacterium]